MEEGEVEYGADSFHLWGLLWHGRSDRLGQENQPTASRPGKGE